MRTALAVYVDQDLSLSEQGAYLCREILYRSFESSCVRALPIREMAILSNDYVWSPLVY